MNVMHSSMKITDQFYANLSDKEIQDRIGNLRKSPEENIDALVEALQSLRRKGTSRWLG